MGKTLDWVQEDPKSGRLIYRRVYPEDVRPFLPKPGQRELKVPLGSTRVMTAAAFRAYENAKLRFAADVAAARASKSSRDGDSESRWDPMPQERIDQLANIFRRQWHITDDEAHREGGGDWVADQETMWNWLHSDFREWRVEKDFEAMEGHWGKAANALLASEGLRVDPDDHDSRARLLEALNDVALEYHPVARERFSGKVVKAPPMPDRPSNPKGGKRTVEALVNAYVADKWEGWASSSRRASGPVSRVLKDMLGDREAATIDRPAAREVFKMVQSLPLNWSKRADLKGLTIHEIAKKGERLGFQTLSAKTVNEGYMVHISGMFNWAEREDWIAKNPFKGLSAADKVDDADRRDPFKADQLQKLFTSAPWDRSPSLELEKPGRFWVPLIALFSGMRLAEIAGLRLMDVEELDGIPAFLIRPHEGRGIKNAESRRNIPIHPELLALGLQGFVDHRRSGGKPSDLLFPDAKANVHKQAGAKLGEWFSSLVNKDHGFEGTKLGMHSFRHNFEDRLRAAGLSGRPEGQALSGRKIAGSEAAYGTSFAMRDLLSALKTVIYPGLDLSHLQ